MAVTPHLRIAAVVCTLLACCGAPRTLSADSAGPAGAWLAPVAQDHPLAGRLWLPASERFAGPSEAVALLSGTRFALLGEKHDNADHHRIQAWLVERIAARRKPAIALEAIDRDRAPALAAYLARHPRDADGIGPALNWSESGWPDWRHYAPIVRPVLDSGGPVTATTPPRAILRQIARQGIAALPPDRVRALGLATDLPPPERAVLVRAIEDGHCGQLPAAMTAPMVTIQRVKDAAMAEALIAGAAAPGRDMAVLIAGNGHVRRDHGVPWHLGRLAGTDAAVALGIVEVRPGDDDPRRYAAGFGVGRLPFDIVWFTPRVDSDDPCAKHAEEFRRLRERRPGPGETR